MIPATLMRTRLLVLAALVSSLAAGATGAAAQTSAKQLEILREAAANGSAPAQYSLGAMAERSGDFATALRLYRQSANAGYAGAQYSLALLLDAGLGTAPDPLEAERLLQRAAANNFEPAYQRLVLMERARAEASKSSAPVPGPPPSTAPGLLARSRQLAVSGWGLATGLALLLGAGLFWSRSRGGSADSEASPARARNRRR